MADAIFGFFEGVEQNRTEASGAVGDCKGERFMLLCADSYAAFS